MNVKAIVRYVDPAWLEIKAKLTRDNLPKIAHDVPSRRLTSARGISSKTLRPVRSRFSDNADHLSHTSAAHFTRANLIKDYCVFYRSGSHGVLHFHASVQTTNSWDSAQQRFIFLSLLVAAFFL